jgi:hypothetical protein
MLTRATMRLRRVRAIDGKELSTEGLEQAGMSVGFEWRKEPTMIAMTLLVLISVCLIFGGYEHAENLRKYNRN